MIGRIGLYVSRMLLTRFAIVLFAVTGFVVLLDMLDVGTRVLGSERGTLEALAWYLLTRVPSLVTDLLPLLAILASLLTALDLVRHREVVIIWGAGITRAGLMLRLLPAGLLLFGLKFAVDEFAVPPTLPALRDLGVVGAGPGAEASIWLHSGRDVVRLPAHAGGVSDIEDVLILVRDPEGRLVERIEAARADVRRPEWRLFDVTRQPASAAPPTHLDEMDWSAGFGAEKLALMTQPPRQMHTLDLLRVVRADGFGIGGTEAQRAWLNARFAGACTMVLCTLLGIALMPTFSRRSIAHSLFTRGLTIGFVAMIVQGVMLAFAESGLFVPEIAAWFVPAALLCIILACSEALPARRRTARLAPA